MNKWDAMNKKRRQDQLKREVAVENACSELSKKNPKFTYQDICESTQIPIKTLEREPYRSIKKKYSVSLSNSLVDSFEIKSLKRRIEYLETVIEQYRKQNSSLKTQLYKLNI